ncbi:MAG TPA: sensor histidine kinase [Planctomycetota bacterium]|nr:sensor histidine kinase [Planctomycetota bacterium]
MTIGTLEQLAALIQRDRDTLLSQWRKQVRQLPSAKHLDLPTLNDHIPQLLEELGAALHLHSTATIPEALREGSPPAHGLQRLQDGFDLEEVVAEYNILRGCIHDLADQAGLVLQGKPFGIVNRVLDGAIGLAVQTFSTQRALEIQRRREEYLTFVAHDLRTPLNAISLTVRILDADLTASGSEDTARMMRMLHRNVQQLEELVRKILEENTHVETETGLQLQRRPFELWPLVESVVRDLQPVARTARTRVANEVPEALVVKADASLLRRIFQNLLSNAIKHTPGGQVTLGARKLDESVVECWVIDNGTGIAPELLEKIFEKGETDGEASGGTGLGLAIVKTFTEAHGGKVSAASKPGTGSAFRFTLPSYIASTSAG